MGEVTGADKAQRCVFVNDADREHVAVPYDYLILATGVRPSYFGHNEFEKFAPSLKTLADPSVFETKSSAPSSRLRPKKMSIFTAIC